MKLYTIGFNKKTSEEFFAQLNQPGLNRVVDVRLRNTSAFAGFTKMADLRFFLRQINDIDYVHQVSLAPSKPILTQFQRTRDFPLYTQHVLRLITERKIEKRVSKSLIDGACLLGSEAMAEKCHRWFVAEYLREKWGDLEIIHL